MLKKIKRFIILTLVAFCTLSTSWVLLYKWAPVKWTPLMLKRSVQNIDHEGYRNHRTWVDIEDISPVMVRAVIASEDGRFMEHRGFDIKEIIKMKNEHKEKGKKIRGCSTISQQVAKNCFTFCGRSWWRKGFETYYTVLIELFWSKERIMEVYLNIAEMGKGVFGVEAAAQKYFDRSAAKLNTHQAVCIACVLPNPLVRSPKTVPQKNQSKYNTTYKRTEQTAYPFKRK
jgi:monofunctional biosynthetic peptidoglycan transglycosylase